MPDQHEQSSHQPNTESQSEELSSNKIALEKELGDLKSRIAADQKNLALALELMPRYFELEAELKIVLAKLDEQLVVERAQIAKLKELASGHEEDPFVRQLLSLHTDRLSDMESVPKDVFLGRKTRKRRSVPEGPFNAANYERLITQHKTLRVLKKWAEDVNATFTTADFPYKYSSVQVSRFRERVLPKLGLTSQVVLRKGYGGQITFKIIAKDPSKTAEIHASIAEYVDSLPYPGDVDSISGEREILGVKIKNALHGMPNDEELDAFEEIEAAEPSSGVPEELDEPESQDTLEADVDSFADIAPAEGQIKEQEIKTEVSKEDVQLSAAYLRALIPMFRELYSNEEVPGLIEVVNAALAGKDVSRIETLLRGPSALRKICKESVEIRDEEVWPTEQTSKMMDTDHQWYKLFSLVYDLNDQAQKKIDPKAKHEGQYPLLMYIQQHKDVPLREPVVPRDSLALPSSEIDLEN